MMAVSLTWDSIYIIQLQSISPKKTNMFDLKRMSNGFSLLHRLNQQSTRNKNGEVFSQITGQHWRMMSSLFLSTGAVQLVPGALIRRGFCWGHRMVFAGSYYPLVN